MAPKVAQRAGLPPPGAQWGEPPPTPPPAPGLSTETGTRSPAPRSAQMGTQGAGEQRARRPGGLAHTCSVKAEDSKGGGRRASVARDPGKQRCPLTGLATPSLSPTGLWPGPTRRPTAKPEPAGFCKSRRRAPGLGPQPCAPPSPQPLCVRPKRASRSATTGRFLALWPSQASKQEAAVLLREGDRWRGRRAPGGRRAGPSRDEGARPVSGESQPQGARPPAPLPPTCLTHQPECTQRDTKGHLRPRDRPPAHPRPPQPAS